MTSTENRDYLAYESNYRRRRRSRKVPVERQASSDVLPFAGPVILRAGG